MQIKNLSIRAMTYIGVSLFEKYCIENSITNSDINVFCSSMMNILNTENISEWNQNCNEIEITGLGDILPNNLVSEYPKHVDNIDRITQSIREISSFQIYGKWIPIESYKFLRKVESLTNVKIKTLKSLPLLEKHNHNNTGFGKAVENDLINEWLKADNKN